MNEQKAKIVAGLFLALLLCTLYFIVTANTVLGMVLVSGFGIYGLISMSQDFVTWLQAPPAQKPAHKDKKTVLDTKWPQMEK